eukprot:m.20888 g.20888  ORF g.20888 m.20888 type:complete len:86 (-) comp10326_c0_seq1:409-666(-)
MPPRSTVTSAAPGGPRTCTAVLSRDKRSLVLTVSTVGGDVRSVRTTKAHGPEKINIQELAHLRGGAVVDQAGQLTAHHQWWCVVS